MKAWLLPFLLMLALMAVGCSTLPRYVISNNSGEIAVISYSYPAASKRDRGVGTCPVKRLGALPETTLDKFLDEATAWQKLSADKYVFDDRQCSVKVAIITGASVTIATQDPFRKTSSALSRVNPELIHLDIQNEKADVRLMGAEVFEKFRQRGEKLYVYDFR